MVERQAIVIGGGLAGCEAAWQIARRGLPVALYEMRSSRTTPAHRTAWLGELVCSNSLGSLLPDRAAGLLKEELRLLGSLVLETAERHAVPAGGALAVDREGFAREITQRVESHPRVTVVRQEVRRVPEDGVVVIAAGPLASEALAEDIARLTGSEGIAFYDAMAPIVTEESVDFAVAFRASRYGRGDDYINCPLTEGQYDAFVAELAQAETTPLRDFEQEDRRFFEACLPVEVMARRGRLVLAYGPLRPVGLIDPRTGQRPFAVVQLRQDDAAGTLYNLVGFQTNLRYGEQERVFRMIPGLERAQFVRYGQMHRNTFIDSPRLLAPSFEYRGRRGLYFAGQITGTEGYMASTAGGLVAGLNAARALLGLGPLIFPVGTMIGALSRYISNQSTGRFQPMKPNFGLLPPLSGKIPRRERYRAYSARALATLHRFAERLDLLPPEANA